MPDVQPETQPRPHRPARPVQIQVRNAWQRLVTALAWSLDTACKLAALVVALHALFSVVPANPANALVQFVGSLATFLSLGLSNLFQLAEPRWDALANYGVAAVLWLLLGSLAARLIRRAAP